MLAKRHTFSLLLLSILSFSLCANENNSTEPPLLSQTHSFTFSNTYWKLSELNDQNISTKGMGREAHIIFSPAVEGEGKFKGASGCNEMLGKYTGEEQNLSIDTKHIAMTRLACPQMETETKLIVALGEVFFWKIENNYLSLMDINGSSIVKFTADQNKTQTLH